MVPDTRYAILGLLVRSGPSHGYQLAVRFGALVGPGWKMNRGQVYGMLQTLEKQGLIERLPEASSRRNSQRYRATLEGTDAFSTWLATPPCHASAHRDTLWLKLVLAGPQHARLLLESLASQEQACVERLGTYAEGAGSAPAGASEWELLAREMIDEATTIQLHGELEWLSKMRARVERVREPLGEFEGSIGEKSAQGCAEAAA